ncbi:MAG: roadblock/LC7 domain-containing protein [Deinococcus-Thermus bacterium]|jgi:predicted regulator of Ras-like GTPase activity (Roadblock/LC7/MglB family)|nr:roadblock/LC7 domain-containing protein [Deinococcota bacterium]
MLEPSLDLYGAAHKRVEARLTDLLDRSRARYALVVDRKGFVLLHVRAWWAPKPPSLDSLATLVASNHSAQAAIAKLFGDDGFREIVHQGSDVGTYVEELGPDALLLIVFDHRAGLGRIKVHAQKAAHDVREELAGLREAGTPDLDLDEHWSESTEKLLDGLFGPRDA